MAPRRTCECGQCQKCKRRAYMNEWYRRPGTAERVRAYAIESRNRRIDKVREYDRLRGDRRTPEAVLANNRARVVPMQPCSVCGSEENVEKHHPDYSRPTDVVFLCRPHHRALHRKVA